MSSRSSMSPRRWSRSISIWRLHSDPASARRGERRAISAHIPPSGTGVDGLTIRDEERQDRIFHAPSRGFPMLTIYGRATSSNTQLVMWAIGELGLEHRRLDYGGVFGKTDTPQYLAMNPMGYVPVLQDGSLTLFE